MKQIVKRNSSALALSLALPVALAACTNTETSGATNESSISASTAPMTCGELADFALSDTIIQSADLVAAGAFTPPPAPGARPADFSSMPEYCRVTGSIQPTPESDIQFEAWLPLEENWNGRFMQVGNGGAAGSMMYSSMAMPLSRGYAVVHTDTGHRGGPGDFSWALDAPESLVDYQYRAVHELTVKGKDITEAFYGSEPSESYWFGCSTGGRQGLMEAQRFPEDYDAIIAGAPANNWSPLQLYSIHFLNNLGSEGLPLPKLGLLKESAIAQCDANDGLADGIISDFGTCDFSPESLLCSSDADQSACLTESELGAAQRLYAGVVTGDGTVAIPGPDVGSEADWAVYATPFFRIGTSWMQNVVLKDPSWDPANFDVDVHLPLAEQADNGATIAMDPDIREFVENGGILLMYHGMADGIIPYGNTENYYQSVVETLGENVAAQHVQFFSVPGMGHCGGGDGASMIDWVSALEDWDQTGSVPDRLMASHPSGSFSRPICEYPQVPTYNGEGDQNDASNFTCQ